MYKKFIKNIFNLHTHSYMYYNFNIENIFLIKVLNK